MARVLYGLIVRVPVVQCGRKYIPYYDDVPCAQRQDVVVAHQRGGGDYLRINSLRRGEGKCRLRWSGEALFPRARDEPGGRAQLSQYGTPSELRQSIQTFSM